MIATLAREVLFSSRVYVNFAKNDFSGGGGGIVSDGSLFSLPVFAELREFFEVSDIFALHYAPVFRLQSPVSIIKLLLNRVRTI